MGFSVARFQEHLATAGYERRDAPLIDDAALFLTKGGDRVIERLITFERGRRAFALRPEFTTSAALHYVRAGAQGVTRWQFSGPIFQEPLHAGDGFVGQQLGAELFGLADSATDAEMIGLAYQGMSQQGLDTLTVAIGHAGLTHAILDGFGLDPYIAQFLLSQRGLLAAKGDVVVRERLLHMLGGTGQNDAPEGDYDAMQGALMAITPRTSAFGGRTREEIARRFVQKHHRLKDIGAIERALAFLSDWVQIEGAPSQVWSRIEPYLTTDASRTLYATWRQTLDILSAYGLGDGQMWIRPDLNRVWDYYSGIMFEFRAGDGKPLGGGGRYDGLMRLFGDANDTPAIGFGLDIEALSRQFEMVTPTVSVGRAIGLWDEGAEVHAAHSAQALRRAGFRVARRDSTAHHQVDVLPDGQFRVNGLIVSDVEALVQQLNREGLA